MVTRKNSPCRTTSHEQGFILVFMLMILAVVLGLTLASASITLYHMKSGNAFHNIIMGQLFASMNGDMPSSSCSISGAPEGWDHISFSTRITQDTTSKMQSCSWRASMREQFSDITGAIPRTAQRPHIIVIVDDSLNMASSSGQDYTDDALYARWPSGGTTHLWDTCEISDQLSLSGCTYFKGTWGNSYHRAPSLPGFTGAMPMWTKHFPRMLSLIESLDLCDVSVMSTSSGSLLPFTMDWPKTARFLEGLYPCSSTCPLSEVLYHAISLFPDSCTSARHIILVTAGIPLHDGNLPAWLRDFDHDGNPRDTAFDNEGSHCLDDVASYARSLGIRVHVIGPRTDFLMDVAAKGGGQFLPGREAFAPESTMITAPAVFHNESILTLSNFRARIDPPWLSTGECSYYRQNIADPSSLVSLPGLALKGLAQKSAADETMLYCTTSRDQLLGITLHSRVLRWLIKGIGGEVRLRGNRILAGPGASGMITCSSKAVQVLWQHKGEHFDASDSVVYASAGSTTYAYHMDTGSVLAQFDINHPITVIRYDPFTGNVLAGTSDGMIFMFSSRLEPTGIITTSITEGVLDIRPYRLHKQPYFLAAGAGMLECHTFRGTVWSVSITSGHPCCVTVMNGRAVLSVWEQETSCGGMETGLSRIEEYDALTGTLCATEVMFTGRAFGPSIDYTKGIMRYISPSGAIYDKDISKMPGITPVPLGRRLIFNLE